VPKFGELGVAHAARTFIQTLRTCVPLAALALPLVACSSASEVLSTDSWFSKPLSLANNPSPNSVARHRISDDRPLGPEDYVDAEGRCPAVAGEAAAVAAAPAGDRPQAAAVPGAAPLPGGGVALEMSECEVVRRTGPPDRVELGANERSERTVVLTYLRGPRPGIYRFTAGRLSVVEKAPEPATPQRPQRQSRPPRA
jgi:hypothetical protein